MTGKTLIWESLNVACGFIYIFLLTFSFGNIKILNEEQRENHINDLTEILRVFQCRCAFTRLKHFSK